MGDSCTFNTGGTLTVVFIVLKLVGVIDCSWFWVVSPVWIGLLIMLIIFLALRWFVS